MYERYKFLALEYNLDNKSIKKLWLIIKDIVNHEEFIKRCNKPYYHHDIKFLGDHIMSDAIVTYKLCLKAKKKNYNIDTKTAVIIAMFHDLYEYPWQNVVNKKRLRNKHGFIHPIEAVINAITWFPDYFKNKDKAMIIIDGIVHHMYPLAVRRIDNTNLELNNQKKYDRLPKKYKDMLKLSLDIGKIGHYSLRRSFFIEGRIMSKADKIVAFRKDIGSVRGYLALVSGKNKNIKKDE